MKTIILAISIFITTLINAQVNEIKTHYSFSGLFFDKYGAFDNINFFHDQSLVNFMHSEERALVSYYSNTSKKNYDKYVLTNEKRDDVYHVGSKTKGKVETIIYNDFDPTLAKHYQDLDTSQSWIDIYFKLRFKYEKEEICIVSYRIVENGYPQGLKSERIIIRTESVKKSFRQVFYIDKRRDEFLDDLTNTIGYLKRSTIRIILGIDKPKTKAEKELVNLVTSSGQNLQINTLVDLFNNQDERLMQFYK
jgi:hypothetical protein